MTTMSGNDIFQTHVLCSFRNGKAGRHIFTGKNIRIRLTDIVNRIHQRFHMSFRQCVTGYIRFVHINCNTGNISFGSPGIDKDTYISPAFQQRIQVGDILLPTHTIGPLVDINRLAFATQAIVCTAVMTDTERGHKTHQFDSRFIILTGNNTNQVFQFRTVYCRELLLSFCYVQQIDSRLFGKDETGTGLIPTVTVGGDCYFQVHGDIAFIVGQCNLLQDDTSVYQMVDTICSRFTVTGILVRGELHRSVVKYLHGIISHRR